MQGNRMTAQDTMVSTCCRISVPSQPQRRSALLPISVTLAFSYPYEGTLARSAGAGVNSST